MYLFACVAGGSTTGEAVVVLAANRPQACYTAAELRPNLDFSIRRTFRLLTSEDHDHEVDR